MATIRDGTKQDGLCFIRWDLSFNNTLCINQALLIILFSRKILKC